jgi:hypothetical protein
VCEVFLNWKTKTRELVYYRECRTKAEEEKKKKQRRRKKEGKKEEKNTLFSKIKTKTYSKHLVILRGLYFFFEKQCGEFIYRERGKDQ